MLPPFRVDEAWESQKFGAWLIMIPNSATSISSQVSVLGQGELVWKHDDEMSADLCSICLCVMGDVCEMFGMLVLNNKDILI